MVSLVAYQLEVLMVEDSKSIDGVTFPSNVHLEGSSIWAAEEDMIDIFFLDVTKVALGSVIDSNLVKMLPSQKSVMMENPNEGFDFFGNF